MLKELIFIIILLNLFLFCCSESNPMAVEIKDVCSLPRGTNVTISGYLALPQMMEVIKYTRNGQVVSMNYKLFLMSEKEANNDSVAVILSATGVFEPNKIKTLPEKYSGEDLVAYTNNGKIILAEDFIKLSGKVNPNDKNGCQINVMKIED